MQFLKKALMAVLVGTTLLTGVFAAEAQAEEPVTVDVKIDGELVNFDVPAQIMNGRTMIPVRAVSEEFEANVGWDGDTSTVTITGKDGTVIVMTLGENFFTKNGEKIDLDVPAFETGGRTLVPARAIAEALDCNVEWDEAAWTVYITKPVKTVKAEIKKDLFAVGNGYNLVDKSFTETYKNSPVTLKETEDGLTVSHGGYYQDGENWGGVAYKEGFELDGLSVTVRFDEVPEVTPADDCWISLDFLTKPELFKVGDISANQGFMNLIRFGVPSIEVYEGVKEFVGITNPIGDTKFAIKSGDIVTMSARLAGEYYEFTYKKGDESVVIPMANSDFTKVFEMNKAHVVVSASLIDSKKDAFRYTITDISHKATEPVKNNASVKKDSFTVGNGYNLVDKAGNVTYKNSPVTVKEVEEGLTVSHGGYYQGGANWGGVAHKEGYKLDGLSATVRFDQVPEVTNADDCWISICFLTKDRLFDVADVPSNQGFMSLIRFGKPHLEVYNGVENFTGAISPVSDFMFGVKSGDVMTLSAKLVGKYYEFTFTKGDQSVVVPMANEAFTKVFEMNDAHVVVSASLMGSEKDAFRYTITDISYAE